MKKRILVVTLGLGMAFLCACGNKDKQSTQEATTEEVIILPEDLNPAEYIKLGQYKGLSVSAKKANAVTDEAVEKQIELYNKDCIEYEEVKDRKVVQAGDVLKVDILCFVNGTADDTYCANDIDFVLGDENNDWIQEVELDYEGNLVGKKVGDTVSIKFTFPEDYEYDGYAGMDAELRMIIRAIEKPKKLEINDAWAKEYMGAKDLEDLRKQVREELEQENQQNETTNNIEAIWDQIIANCTQIKEFPEEKMNEEIEAQTVMAEDTMAFGEITEKEYQDQYLGGLTIEEYVHKNLVRQCAEKLIIEQEGIVVTHADVTSALEEEVNGDDFETLEDVIDARGGEEMVKEELQYEKLNDLLLKENKIVQ